MFTKFNQVYNQIINECNSNIINEGLTEEGLNNVIGEFEQGLLLHNSTLLNDDFFNEQEIKNSDFWKKIHEACKKIQNRFKSRKEYLSYMKNEVKSIKNKKQRLQKEKEIFDQIFNEIRKLILDYSNSISKEEFIKTVYKPLRNHGLFQIRGRNYILWQD